MKTPGGNRLKALREYTGKTQLEVELDASLGIGYLQRVESGKVRFPERDTLERILAALGAPYTDRRDILELFGYIVDYPLPGETDIRQAIDICREELDGAVFPAYLLDCKHRLLAWNGFFPRLFPAESFAAESYRRASMIRVLFDPRYHLTPLIANADTFFPAQIRALRYEMHVFRGEPWYAEILDELTTQCPLFNDYWLAASQRQPNDQIAARPLVPLVVKVSGVGLLQFRLTSEPFAHDRRFRLIYYIPADALAISWCIQPSGGDRAG